jgi:hypothetical protein
MKMNMNIKHIDFFKLTINFIPIILLYLFATYTTEFAKFSHTSIGKAFAILLILFYVKLDFIIGLFVCALVVFYYQTDYIESFDNMLKEDANIDEKIEDDEKIDDDEKIKHENDDDNAKIDEKIDDDKAENFETLYCDANNKHIIDDKSKNEFRKTYCKNGHLIHKGQIIKHEMSEFIYPIKQKSEYTKCNICDTTCDFDILHKRIDDESQLINPKNSNELFEKVWTNMKTSTEKLQKYFDKE